jgi:hypothetical protein
MATIGATQSSINQAGSTGRNPYSKAPGRAHVEVDGQRVPLTSSQLDHPGERHQATEPLDSTRYRRRGARRT